MPIDLGLARVTKLLSHFNNPHLKYKSIHVAGTNGKGSTLAYISSILTQSRIRNGKFTSPHLVDINDCITINNETYLRSIFDTVNKSVVQIDKELQLKCTEFELLTVTALRIFELEKVDIALIEVGVGGRLDATNVLTSFYQEDANENSPIGGVIATAITKIDMDHEKLLGDSLDKIAMEKAGIMKPRVPCFVDSLNTSSVLSVLCQNAETVGCPFEAVTPGSEDNDLIDLSPLKGDYQIHNLSLALRIIRSIKHSNISLESIAQGIRQTNWPARLQHLQINKTFSVLLDGAHNESAAIELGKYVRDHYNGKHITFIIGVTRGKDLNAMLKHLVKPQDTVIPVKFLQPDQMPWIKCETPENIAKIAKTHCQVDDTLQSPFIEDAVSYIKSLEEQHGILSPVVICGSLYLCSDVLRAYGKGYKPCD